MNLKYVSLKQTQYHKASTLICSIPFPRNDIVLAKYIFCITIYFACCLIFGIETLLFPQLRNIGFEIPVILFLIVSLFLGVYLPVQYKFGYEKTKLFFVVLIMASPFVLAQSLKMKNSLNINIFENINPIFFFNVSLVISVLILTIFSAISIKIFKNSVFL